MSQTTIAAPFAVPTIQVSPRELTHLERLRLVERVLDGSG